MSKKPRRRLVIQLRVAAEEPRLRYRGGVAFGEYAGHSIGESEAHYDRRVDLNDVIDEFANFASTFRSTEVRQ